MTCCASAATLRLRGPRGDPPRLPSAYHSEWLQIQCIGSQADGAVSNRLRLPKLQQVVIALDVRPQCIALLYFAGLVLLAL